MNTAASSKATIQLGAYRSKGDVTRAILEFLTEGPQTQTAVMYRAYMSHAMLKSYRAWLEEAGLVKIDSSNKWGLTDKGLRYAKALLKAEDILKEAQA